MEMTVKKKSPCSGSLQQRPSKIMLSGRVAVKRGIKPPSHQNNETAIYWWWVIWLGSARPFPTPYFNPCDSFGFWCISSVVIWCYLHLGPKVARFMAYKLKRSERSFEELRVEFTEGELQRSCISKCCIRIATEMLSVLFLNRMSLEWVNASDMAFKGHMVRCKSLWSWLGRWLLLPYSSRSNVCSESILFSALYKIIRRI